MTPKIRWEKHVNTQKPLSVGPLIRTDLIITIIIRMITYNKAHVVGGGGEMIRRTFVGGREENWDKEIVLRVEARHWNPTR